VYQRFPFLVVVNSAHAEIEDFEEDLVGKYIDCSVVYIMAMVSNC
jgi:hypothetical protein